MKTLCIALPTHNEAANIGPVLDRLLQYLPACPAKARVVVIDNCSSDSTCSIVENEYSRHPQIELIRHKENKLYSGSCETAIKSCQEDFLVIMDSDGQYEPADIDRFLAKANDGYALLLGWRKKRQDPLLRKVATRVFRLLGKFWLRSKVHDLNCGMRLLDRSFMNGFVMTHRINMANPELLTHATRNGLRVGEIPITHYHRTAGESCLPKRRALRTLLTVNMYFRSLHRSL